MPPVRTCVGCRQTDSQQNLIRFVLCDATLIPDPDRRLPGRGAWLHDSETCRELATKRHGFDRSFRTKVS